MTTASKITMARIILIPFFFAVTISGMNHANTIGLIIFIVASLTDSLDGYVARKYDQVSNFGKFLDPLADKLLVTAAILIFVERGQMASWAAMLILTREFAVTGLRLIAVERGSVIAAGISGKIKTASSIVAICFMLTPMHEWTLIPDVLSVNSLCVIVMVVTTLWSGIEYFVQNRSVFAEKG